jgi:putative transcriptional regulator
MKNTKRAAKQRTVAQDIIGGLTDVRDALRAGQRLEDRFTVRTVDLDLEPQEYDAQAVRGVRNALKASQALFAKILGVDVNTVQSWEQGVRTPSPMARRFMDEIRHDPRRWIERFQEATTL